MRRSCGKLKATRFGAIFLRQDQVFSRRRCGGANEDKFLEFSDGYTLILYSILVPSCYEYIFSFYMTVRPNASLISRRFLFRLATSSVAVCASAQ
jgi:hypothetical protein